MPTRAFHKCVFYVGLALISISLVLAVCTYHRWAYVKLTLLLAGVPHWSLTFNKYQDGVPLEFQNDLGVAGLITTDGRVVATVMRFRQVDAYPFIPSNAALQLRFERANRACAKITGVWPVQLLIGLLMTICGGVLSRTSSPDARI
jgi:hypothetical protein